MEIHWKVLKGKTKLVYKIFTVYSGCCIENRLLGAGRKEAMAVTMVRNNGTLTREEAGTGNKKWAESRCISQGWPLGPAM